MEMEKAMIINKMKKTITAILAMVLLPMVALAGMVNPKHEEMAERFRHLTDDQQEAKLAYLE